MLLRRTRRLTLEAQCMVLMSEALVTRLELGKVRRMSCSLRVELEGFSMSLLKTRLTIRS